jgi:hypothetical protein
MDAQTARAELESNKRKAMDAGGVLSRKAVLHRDQPQCAPATPLPSSIRFVAELMADLSVSREWMAQGG